MWEIYEHKKVEIPLKDLPHDILVRYEKWKDIVYISGPKGLKLIRGFRDEALLGKWNGHRSSMLNLQYRVIYKVINDQLLVQVLSITPHDFRRN